MPTAPKGPNDLGAPIQSGASVDSLDFERTDRAEGVCAQCATPITDRYYTLGPHLICESCHLAFQNAKAPGNAASRFLGAAALGTVAAAIGCALWMLVTELTGYQIGLIAIVVGYIVGIAVHVGARRVGGPVYQLLAVFLTYTAIVMTYVPMIVNQLMASGDSGGSVVLAWYAAVPLAYAVPFLMGFENIIGILIIGFALWQAFRMNAHVKIEMQGPFRLEVRDPALG
jgi:hypothetical protein